MSDADPVRPEPSRALVRRLLDGLYTLSGILAGFFLVAIFVIMLTLSAGRPLGIDVPAADDFASWCMAATAFLGLAYTFRSGEIIRVGLLIDRFKGRTKRVFEAVCLLIGAASMIYFAWYAIDMTVMSWRFNDLSQGVIAVPLWFPQLGFSGGVAILAVAFVDELVHVVTGGTPRYEKPEAKTAEEVIERAIQSGA
ncbi:TRAP transporter small permease [Pseudomonas sp. R2.Fl]|nr:TRAP transporter small permease [Pseudomonas sp. R2.Fl]